MKRKKKDLSRHSRTKLPKEPVSWKYCVATVVFGLLIASGFFWAANLHFVSMNYGIENNRLRGQIEELRSGNRRLTLKRELALTPQEIMEAANRIGLRARTVSSILPEGAEPDFKAEPALDRGAEPTVVKTVLRTEATTPAKKPQKANDRASKLLKTVKTYPPKATVALQKPAKAEKTEDPKTATRSRIIENVSKR